MAAINMASRSVRLGESNVVIAGGVENMSKVPYFLTDLRWGHRLGDVTLKDQLVIACPMTGRPRAVQAGEEAVEFGVTREEQDRWAWRSHQNYFKAKVEAIRAKTNVNGGAIAMGHPTGATAGRMVMTLMYELRRMRKAAGSNRPYYGLATLCGGIGEGEAVIVKVDN